MATFGASLSVTSDQQLVKPLPVFAYSARNRLDLPGYTVRLISRSLLHQQLSRRGAPNCRAEHVIAVLTAVLSYGH